MSLDWGLDKIENHLEKCWIPASKEQAKNAPARHHDEEEDQWYEIHPVTNALIWNCMLIDMNGITEKNFEEYVRRTLLAEQVFGPLLRIRDEETDQLESRWLTREDVREHIGLSTNVYTETKAKFRKKLERWLEDKVTQRIREEKAKMEEEAA